ncbi:unnamed protein product [Allacma fusca]|uniref:ADP-ribosylglycohydrolase n=1 Tax=Allacma fusca TaxID=39272 RepID=A0A8J2PZ10_9HEXA|nr:unnamed protein product [Allacma fusca]
MGEVDLNQFKGCMIGLLVGDCLGFPYENESSSYIPLNLIRKDLKGIKDGSLESRCLTDTGRKQYTDDTSMSICVSKFLLESPSGNLDYRDLAQRYKQGC